jgi:hypothetical protein
MAADDTPNQDILLYGGLFCFVAVLEDQEIQEMQKQTAGGLLKLRQRIWTNYKALTGNQTVAQLEKLLFLADLIPLEPDQPGSDIDIDFIRRAAWKLREQPGGEHNWRNWQVLLITGFFRNPFSHEPEADEVLKYWDSTNVLQALTKLFDGLVDQKMDQADDIRNSFRHNLAIIQFLLDKGQSKAALETLGDLKEKISLPAYQPLAENVTDLLAYLSKSLLDGPVVSPPRGGTRQRSDGTRFAIPDALWAALVGRESIEPVDADPSLAASNNIDDDSDDADTTTPEDWPRPSFEDAWALLEDLMLGDDNDDRDDDNDDNIALLWQSFESSTLKP